MEESISESALSGDKENHDSVEFFFFISKVEIIMEYLLLFV